MNAPKTLRRTMKPAMREQIRRAREPAQIIDRAAADGDACIRMCISGACARSRCAAMPVNTAQNE